MTTLSSILDLVQTTLDGNATINAYCLAAFHRIPSVFIGLNPLDPPDFSGNCPMIVVGTGTRARETNQANRIHTIRIGTAIEDKSTAESASGQVIRYAGITALDEFADVVEKEITKALNAAGFAATQEPEFEDETIPPYFKATWSFTVRCPSRLR